MTGVIDGAHSNACLSQDGKEGIQAAGRTGVMELLDSTHNIISVGQEVIPEHLKGHTLIIYLPERDAIVIDGWKENTSLIVELIANYLELTPCQHENVLESPYYKGLPGKILGIWQVLEGIYQVRQKKEQ